MSILAQLKMAVLQNLKPDLSVLTRSAIIEAFDELDSDLDVQGYENPNQEPITALNKLTQVLAGTYTEEIVEEEISDSVEEVEEDELEFEDEESEDPYEDSFDDLNMDEDADITEDEEK